MKFKLLACALLACLLGCDSSIPDQKPNTNGSGESTNADAKSDSTKSNISAVVEHARFTIGDWSCAVTQFDEQGQISSKYTVEVSISQTDDLNFATQKKGTGSDTTEVKESVRFDLPQGKFVTTSSSGWESTTEVVEIDIREYGFEAIYETKMDIDGTEKTGRYKYIIEKLDDNRFVESLFLEFRGRYVIRMQTAYTRR